MTKFGPEPAQNMSHLSHFAARHVFGELPQRRTRRWCVASMPECARLLLSCSPRALPTPGCRSGQTPERLPQPSPPPARSLHPSATLSEAPMAAGALLCCLPPSCSCYGVPLCYCCFHREDMARAWPRLTLQQPSAGRSPDSCSPSPVPSLLGNRKKKGPRVRIRCEAKTHINSVCGLWRDSWKS